MIQANKRLLIDTKYYETAWINVSSNGKIYSPPNSKVGTSKVLPTW